MVHSRLTVGAKRPALPPWLLCLEFLWATGALPTDADDRCFELQYDASTTLAKLVHDLVLLAQCDHVDLGHYGRVPVATAYECLNRTANRPPPSWSPYSPFLSRSFMRYLSLYTSSAALGFLLYFLHSPRRRNLLGRGRYPRIGFEGKGKDLPGDAGREQNGFGDRERDFQQASCPILFHESFNRPLVGQGIIAATLSRPSKAWVA